MRSLTSFRSVELSSGGPVLIEKEWSEPRGTPYLVVAPTLVGICGSDLKEVRGERPHRTDFGHEFVGSIVASSGVPDRPCGMRVTLNPNVPIVRNSGFSELVTACASAERLHEALLPVEGSLTDGEAVFTEPLAIATHCANRLRRNMPFAGQRPPEVAIAGAGTMAILIMWVLTNAGASVRIFNRTASRLDKLSHRGLLTGPFDAIDNMPRSAFDCVIVATAVSNNEVLARALSAIRPNGLLQLFGGTSSGDKIPSTDVDLHAIRTKELFEALPGAEHAVTIGGSYGATSTDFQSAMLLLGDRSLPFDRLVTERLVLEELPGRLLRLAAGSGYEKSMVEITAA